MYTLPVLKKLLKKSKSKARYSNVAGFFIKEKHELKKIIVVLKRWLEAHKEWWNSNVKVHEMDWLEGSPPMSPHMSINASPEEERDDK